ALFNSRLWKFLTPIRQLRRWLRPRGFSAAALLPWRQLEPDREAAPGTWLATGPSPFFIVPCELPAGGLRVRLRMSSEVPGRLALYAIGGNGSADLHHLKQLDVQGRVEIDEVLRLPSPALGLRLDPITGPGRFHLDALDVL